MVVTAADVAAQRAGLRPGMPASKAQALVPGLVTRDADPAADADALHHLALWALRRYSPVAAADWPDGLVIDASGAAHLHGGEEALLADLVHRLTGRGISARAALADSWGAAHATVRFAGQPILVVPPGGSADAIANLPIASLRVDQHTVAALRVLGFNRVGELMTTPRAPLTNRFGPEILRRLDQALGRLAEPIDPVRPPDIVAVRRLFAEPIAAAETIARYIGKLTTQLCDMLEERGLGARRLDLLCHRVDNRVEAVRVGTAAPVRDARRLTRLLCDRIETIDPGFGIEAMGLAAVVAEPLAPRQTGSLTEEAEPDVSDLIDTLANRVGEHRLYRFAAVPSDVPERSVRKELPLGPDLEAEWPSRWPRPVRLLPAPEPIDTIAVLPDHPPSPSPGAASAGA